MKQRQLEAAKTHVKSENEKLADQIAEQKRKREEHDLIMQQQLLKHERAQEEKKNKIEEKMQKSLEKSLNSSALVSTKAQQIGLRYAEMQETITARRDQLI